MVSGEGDNIPLAPNVQKMETGVEAVYLVDSGSEDECVIKIPRRPYDDKSEFDIVRNYIDLNDSLGHAVEQNRGEEGLEFLQRVEVLDMEPVLFSPSMGHIEGTDLREESAKVGWHYGIRMPNLTPDDSYGVFDPSIFSTFRDKREGDPKEQEMREFALRAEKEIRPTLQAVHDFAVDNNIQPAREDNSFHIRIHRETDGSFNWAIVPLDYTNSYRLTDELREAQSEYWRREGTQDDGYVEGLDRRSTRRPIDFLNDLANDD